MRWNCHPARAETAANEKGYFEKELAEGAIPTRLRRKKKGTHCRCCRVTKDVGNRARAVR